MVISNKLPVESLMDIWVNRKTYILEGACLAVLALSQGPTDKASAGQRSATHMYWFKQ